jgi:CheY-like chemotaxis protein
MLQRRPSLDAPKLSTCSNHNSEKETDNEEGSVVELSPSGPTPKTGNPAPPLHPLILLSSPPITSLKDGRSTVKILLVEDSRVLRLSNERALIKAGYKVITAEDGESALQRAKKQQPDLILLDLLLPKVSGLEVLTRLKHNRATARISVVAVSGLSEKNRQRLIEAGAEDYLEKSSVITDQGMNRLAQVLEGVICRINRKRGINFSPILDKK